MARTETITIPVLDADVADILSITQIPNLTTNGFIKTTGGDGTLSIDTATYFSNPMTTLGDLIYGGASGAATRLAGDTSNTRKFLRELSVTGTATAPVWDTITATDVGLGNVTNESKATMFTSPTFTGTVTIPTPFTLGAVSVTTTGTQLNYLNAATGTTGTNTTSIVFSTSPTLVTPILGVASATSLRLANNNWLSGVDYAGTSYINMFKVNASDEIDCGATLNISGYIEGPTDGGAITVLDMPVVSAADDTEESLTFKIDGNNFLKLYSLADGAGAIDTQSIRAYYAILPNTSDLAALGSATLMWSDLFLASGGVINWNNGNATLTHSTGLLTSNVPLSLGTSNALTCGSVELGHATENTLSASGGVLSIEGTAIPKGTGTANEIAYWSGTNTLGTLAVATYPSLTELSYVKGVTSAIQTQLGNKAPSANPTFTGTVILPKTIEIQDTSVDHQYVLAVSELTADRIITLPLLTGTDTFVFEAHTQTLTNKRVTKRVTTTTDDATAVIDIDTCDVYQLSAVANNTELTTTGTPTDGQQLVIRLKDAGVAKNLTWTGFTAIGVTLPATTTAGKWMYFGATYNSAASQWHIIAYNVQA